MKWWLWFSCKIVYSNCIIAVYWRGQRLSNVVIDLLASNEFVEKGQKTVLKSLLHSDRVDCSFLWATLEKWKGFSIIIIFSYYYYYCYYNIATIYFFSIGYLDVLDNYWPHWSLRMIFTIELCSCIALKRFPCNYWVMFA